MIHRSKISAQRVLVVEDDAILAIDVSMIVEDAGHRVEGPYHHLQSAMAFDALETVAVGLLDVDLGGHEIFPFADRCVAAGVPIIFHTGRKDVTSLRRRYPDAEIVAKPSTSERILEALDRATTGRTQIHQMPRCAAAF